MTTRTPEGLRRALRSFMKAKKLEVRPWAKKAGVSYNALYNFLSGRSNSLNHRTVEKLAAAAKVPAPDIFPTHSLTSLNEKTTIDHVAVVGRVKAGTWGETWMLEQDARYEIGVPPSETLPSSAFALRVDGPSMNLEYPDGSHVICIPLGDTSLKENDHVIVQRTRADGQVEATCKELRLDSEGRAWLWPRSTHPAHQAPIAIPWPYDAELATSEGIENIQIIAVVHASYRRRPR